MPKKIEKVERTYFNCLPQWGQKAVFGATA
jgi:hypothetical protein